MKPCNEVQIIHLDGKPVFAVVPYEQYLAMTTSPSEEQAHIPREVVGLQVEQGLSLVAAWRTHKGLSQLELGERLGISQSAVAQMEKPGSKPRHKTLQKMAKALGVTAEQLTE